MAARLSQEKSSSVVRELVRRAALACAALMAMACGGSDEAPADTATARLSPEEEANVEVATRVIEQGLGRADLAVIDELVRPDYIQHNAQAEDGREGLIGFVSALLAPQGGTDVTIHRTLASGDYVALHSTYGSGAARQVAFDVFRLEGGQLAEHWDALQSWVEPAATVSGRTQVDGETTVTDRQLTEENEQLVTALVREVFVEGRVERLPEYIGEPYLQHNPRIGDGLPALQAFLEAVENQGVEFGYTRSPLVVADGNFVLVGSEGYLNRREDYTIFYDLYRVDAGRVVEHWDVIQAIDLAAVPHDNGLF